MGEIPDILCHVYRAEDFTGIPTETDEAVPVWAPLQAIPYHRMWEDDIYWLPLLLAGTTEAPMGAGAKTAVSLAGGSVGALLAGRIFARRTEAGEAEFNNDAAIIGGLLGAVFLRGIL